MGELDLSNPIILGVLIISGSTGLYSVWRTMNALTAYKIKSDEMRDLRSEQSEKRLENLLSLVLNHQETQTKTLSDALNNLATAVSFLSHPTEKANGR